MPAKLITRRKLIRVAALAAPAIIIPGRHPAKAWIHGAPPPPAPAIAQAAGFHTTTFFDHFTSLNTIDLANTKQAGFKWYIQNAFPQAQLSASGNLGWVTQGVNGGSIVSGGPSNPADFSVSNSILSINGTSISSSSWQLHTVCPTGTGTTSVGQSFSGGAYFGYYAAVDISLLIAGSRVWPAVWSSDIRWLLGQVLRFPELDHMEWYPNNGLPVQTLSGMHDWIMNPSGVAQDLNNNGVNQIIPGVVDANFHLFETVWRTAAQNGGTGLIQRYFDGTLISSINVTYTPGGQYSDLDSAQLMLILCGGIGVPLNIDYIQVCQTP